MKTNRLFSLIFPRFIAAANDLEELAIANALDGEGVFQVEQGKDLFIPFGDYAHPKGLQKFDAQSGGFLAQAFNSLPAKVGRLFSPGVPIYRGHPDVPGRPDSDPAAPAMGWVQGVTVENDGVRLAVKWNADGEAAIGNAHFRFYSPNWLLRPVKGGIQPVKLLSVGLTNNPRIPVPAIANDDNQPDDMKLTDILRKLLGIAAENDAPTEAQIDEAAQAVQVRLDQLTTAANDAATLAPKLAKAEGDLAAVIAERTALKGDLTAANDALTAARTRYISLRLDPLTEQTRVLPAERDTLQAELLAIANDDDLEARFEALAKTEPKLKTAATAKDLKGGKAKIMAANDEAARREQIREAIDDELTAIANDKTKAAMTDGARYDLAFQRASTKHPNLFPATPAKTA